jgi:ABC-type dipeptide/oligopeptide/nickel transport system ATPase component
MPPVKWKQGEHVIIVGDTGSGKTYLESKLLALRQHVIVLRTKPDNIIFDGFHKVPIVGKIGSQRFDDAGRLITKFLLVPKYEDQQKQASLVFERVWKEGAWCIAIDETYYATQILKLEKQINKLLTQGRSKNVSIVCGMQRPAWVSRFALSQATHAFIFRCEGKDLKSLAESLSPVIIRPVEDLREHDFIYFNRATRTVVKGNANKLSEIIY